MRHIQALLRHLSHILTCSELCVTLVIFITLAQLDLEASSKAYRTGKMIKHSQNNPWHSQNNLFKHFQRYLGWSMHINPHSLGCNNQGSQQFCILIFRVFWIFVVFKYFFLKFKSNWKDICRKNAISWTFFN